MYKKLSCVICFFLLSTQVQAMWQKMTDQQLIDHSVLIVSATLLAKPLLQLDSPLSLGVLIINSVYQGDASEKAILIKLPYAAPPEKGLTTVNSHHLNYSINQTGIWFLRRDNQGFYYADHPQRFWSIDKDKNLKKLLINLGGGTE